MSSHIPVLLLHGFTSSLDCVKKPADLLREAGFDVETPILRGHGTRWEDLRGVTAADWFEDARKALFELHEKHGCAVAVVGLSMGGLVALDLGIHYPEKIRIVVAVTPALVFSNPAAGFSPFLAGVIPWMPSPNAYEDQNLRKRFDRNYPRFPVKTFASLFIYSREVRARLPRLKVPVHLMHSLRDRVISPRSTRIVLETADSARKSVSWYCKSGHEMFLDLESDAAAAEVRDCLLGLEGEGAG